MRSDSEHTAIYELGRRLQIRKKGKDIRRSDIGRINQLICPSSASSAKIPSVLSSIEAKTRALTASSVFSGNSIRYIVV
jgi:hypothetical protein